MVILLDIGNTSISYGICRKGRLLKSLHSSKNNIPKIVYKCLSSGTKKIKTVVISSVNPKKTLFIEKSLIHIKHLKVLVIGRDIHVKIANKYKCYKALGSDRIVNAYGAVRLYKPPLLIFDFGTAVTSDIVSGKGTFEGGMIIPGPAISAEALSQRAALVPHISGMPPKPKGLIGRDTKSCISSGIYEGYGAMTDGLVRRFRQQYGKRLKVVVTGGFTHVLRKYIHEDVTFDPLLTLKSLFLIYKDRMIKKNGPV